MIQITQHGLWLKATARPGLLPEEMRKKLLSLVFKSRYAGLYYRYLRRFFQKQC